MDFSLIESAIDGRSDMEVYKMVVMITVLLYSLTYPGIWTDIVSQKFTYTCSMKRALNLTANKMKLNSESLLSGCLYSCLYCRPV